MACLPLDFDPARQRRTTTSPDARAPAIAMSANDSAAARARLGSQAMSAPAFMLGNSHRGRQNLPHERMRGRP